MKRTISSLNTLLRHIAHWCGQHQHLLREHFEKKRRLRDQLDDRRTNHPEDTAGIKRLEGQLKATRGFPPPEMITDKPEIAVEWGSDVAAYRIAGHIRDWLWDASPPLKASAWWAFRGYFYELGKAPNIPPDDERVYETTVLLQQKELSQQAGTSGTAPATTETTTTKASATSKTVKLKQVATPVRKENLARMQENSPDRRRSEHQMKIVPKRITTTQSQIVTEEVADPQMEIEAGFEGEPLNGIIKLADFVEEFEALALRQALYFRVENDVFVLIMRSEMGDQWFSRLLMLRDEHSTIRLAEFTGCQEEFNEKVEYWIKADYAGPEQLMEALNIKCIEYFQQSQA